MNKRFLPVVAGALSLGLLFTGCASDDADDEKGPDTIVVPADGWDVNVTPYDSVKDGGTITMAYGSKIDTFNVWSATGNDYEWSMLEAPISSTFYLFDGGGNATLDENFLESADAVITDGKMVLTIKMNPKAIWNSGRQIDANDWIATVAAMNGENEAFTPASSDGWNQIESVEQGANAQEVIFTFKSTYPDWIAIIGGGPLPKEGCETPEAFNNGWATFNNDWFTGPFKIDSIDASSGTITQVPNDKWWGPKPKLDKIIWKLVLEEQRAQAFANQEIDFYDIGANADGYLQAKGAINSVVRESRGPNWRHFTFNSSSAVLSDVNVRQAIAMGLDRAAIAESDLAGLPIDPTPLNNNIYTPGQDGYVDLGAKTGIEYDQAGAKTKLEAAGWVLGEDGFYAKDGAKLAVRFAILTGVAASENEFLQAQAQLKEIGVDLVARPVDVNSEWPGILDSGDFDIIAFSWMGTTFPLANIGQIYGTGSDSNFSRLSNPTLDGIIAKMDVEVDAAARKAFAQQAAEEIWNGVMTLPLYQRPQLAGVRDTLANIGAFGMARNPYTWVNVGYVK
ncbi:MAG: ABC transporter family substrate-binding protein [Propionibacteriaceae bacterium]|jgi:peptide/nickel transport system substrate-binding protein|nr:ABC transporter family substrate-binding protein [Propionibacteriaceae bacterium]